VRYEDIDRHGKSAKGRKEILKYLDGGRLTQADGRDIMDEERQYIDADGNKRSLFWMVRHEPEWAANVIRSLKNRIAEKDREIGQLKQKLHKSYSFLDEALNSGDGVYRP
jgi:hypothetical protein